MGNSNRKELEEILAKFVESSWDLIAVPSKTWLDGKGDVKELLAAVEQADKDCGSCGCEYDPLYKKAIRLLKTA